MDHAWERSRHVGLRSFENQGYTGGLPRAHGLNRGVSDTVAKVLVSEIGMDMARFPTPGHLVSWAGPACASTRALASRAPPVSDTAPPGSRPRWSAPAGAPPARAIPICAPSS